MARVIVIGVAGEDGLWVADLDAGTVTPLPDPKTGDLRNVADLRAAGASVIKGVDVAITVKATSSAAGGHMDG
ncbi:hypothetical protein G6L29_29955 [Agrobacterium rhizogenes]|jgi:hypothetical protein|uniref:hypothetical protein n=1 Tax=Rhizobium rhizogenes TaxID=359 RepID=UPI0004D63D0A|nr:hypothetical protein [Rhizobium rhizogenes]OCI99358.1 hypothetical protein A6U85_31720 [Agrobacterium sp. 13-626]OCJ20383.1 hypothetical protein A6U88_31805 [Agrobacterium sp. B131/95]KEA07769.1 hypothetical protein CN09_00920 [Rhizobium rhizogenes]MDJ1637624.1 hypothetical protein [Rhizobium rhizogenes]MQB34131.1 hypothetical protein [Rhizobium rhizogenes]